MFPYGPRTSACCASSPRPSRIGAMAWSATWPGWEAMRATRSGWMQGRSSRPTCPAWCWPRRMRPDWTTKCTSHGPTTAPPCCRHEEDLVVGPAGAQMAVDRAAVPVAGAFPAAAFPARPEDQLCRTEVRHSAVYAPGRAEGPDGDAGAQPAGIRAPVHRQPVHRHLPEFGEDGGRDHLVLRAHRLSHGVLHCALASLGAQPAAAGRDTAFLDLAAAARLCLGGHSAQRRPAQQSAAMAGADFRTAGNLPYGPGRVHRPGLCLPAVFRAAPVRNTGEAGHTP